MGKNYFAINNSPTNLIIDDVELGQQYAVDELRVGAVGVVSERLVKLDQLVNSLVSNQRFTDEQNQIRLVHSDQLQRKNERV